MEEEDGRPGARAEHHGPPDAPRDVPALSLPIASRNPMNLGAPSLLALETWDNFRTCTALLQNEEKNENVPGK